jgi:uncharacterized membrane protein
MADLDRRPGRPPSRRRREQRAYTLVVTGAVAGLVGVVGVVLAIAGVIGGGIPVVALIVALACWVMFRRAVGGR